MPSRMSGLKHSLLIGRCCLQRHIFYEDDLSEDDKTLYRQMMTVFDSNSPTYHIALRDDKPVCVEFRFIGYCSSNAVQPVNYR